MKIIEHLISIVSKKYPFVTGYYFVKGNEHYLFDDVYVLSISYGKIKEHFNLDDTHKECAGLVYYHWFENYYHSLEDCFQYSTMVYRLLPKGNDILYSPSYIYITP